MRDVLTYAAACAGLVLITAGVVTPLLPPGARAGLWVAGGGAWLLQLGAAGAWVRWGSSPTRFLAVMAWSAGARLLAIGAAGAAVWRLPDLLHPVSTLVGLAGYLFMMLLMEPMMLRAGSTT